MFSPAQKEPRSGPGENSDYQEASLISPICRARKKDLKTVCDRPPQPTYSTQL